MYLYLNFLLQFIQAMNTLKRVLKEAVNDYYALYRFGLLSLIMISIKTQESKVFIHSTTFLIGHFYFAVILTCTQPMSSKFLAF